MLADAPALLADAVLAAAAFAELADEAALRDSPHPGSAKAAAPSTAAPVRLKNERLVNIVQTPFFVQAAKGKGSLRRLLS